jgi:hypothetical protein
VSADFFFFFFSCLRDELSKPGRHFLVCVVNGNAFLTSMAIQGKRCMRKQLD